MKKERIHVMVTAAEKDMLERLMAAMFCTRSAVVRAAIRKLDKATKAGRAA